MLASARCEEIVLTAQSETALAYLVARDAEAGAELARRGHAAALKDVQHAGQLLHARNQEWRLMEQQAVKRWTHECEFARECCTPL